MYSTTISPFFQSAARKPCIACYRVHVFSPHSSSPVSTNRRHGRTDCDRQDPFFSSPIRLAAPPNLVFTIVPLRCIDPGEKRAHSPNRDSFGASLACQRLSRATSRASTLSHFTEQQPSAGSESLRLRHPHPLPGRFDGTTVSVTIRDTSLR